MKNPFAELRVRFVFLTAAILLALLPLSSVSGGQDGAVREGGYLFAISYLPKEEVLRADDGRVWLLAWKQRARLPDAAQVTAWPLGPIALPETDDVNSTFSIDVTGIKHVVMENRSVADRWRLLYSLEQRDSLPHAIAISLQIQIDGDWFYVIPYPLDVGEHGEMPLLAGADEPQVFPGHYRLVVSRCFRGQWALAVKEFNVSFSSSENEYVLS